MIEAVLRVQPILNFLGIDVGHYNLNYIIIWNIQYLVIHVFFSFIISS